MCSLALALTGLTTGLQMAGQYQQSRAQAASLEAQSQAAKAQADAAYQNAKIQSRQSEQMAEQYAQQQRSLDARRKLVIGQQTAQAGASGIAGGVGSSLDMYNATMDAYNEDSINLLNNQRNSMYSNYVQEVNLRNQGNAYTAQSANYKAQASAAKSAGNVAMIGTLLGGAASMYGMKGAGSSSSSGAVYAAPDSIAMGTQAVKKINAFNNAYSGWGTANLYNPGTFKTSGGFGV